MTPQTVFGLVGQIALVGWLILAVFGRKRWASELVCGRIIPIVLSAVYLAIFAVYGPSAEGGFDSLDSVAKLFANPWILLAGWVHYLAFDLFVGAWEARDAARSRISHWAMIPCFVLTFMLGPIGLLAYLALKGVVGLARGRNEVPSEAE